MKVRETYAIEKRPPDPPAQKPVTVERTKHEPGDPEWERMANRVARQFVIIARCCACGRPRIRDYCCTFCGGE